MGKFYTILLVGLIVALAGGSVADAGTLFTKDLFFGIQGDQEVTKLQEFLADQGVYSGPITGNFFSLTLAGVRNFQSRESITPTAGYFGPLTRARANELLGGQLGASEQQAISETGSSPVIPPPPATTGDVVSSLQAQINILLQQVQLLQQQLTAQQQTQQTLQQIQQQTAPPPPPPPPSPADTVSPVITSVQASNVTTNSAVITWMTNEHGDSVVFLGLSPGVYFSSTNGTISAVSNGYLHTVNLSSLTPNTTYYYKVTSKDSSGNQGASEEYSFTTAQTPPSLPTLPTPTMIIGVDPDSLPQSKQITIGQTNVPLASFRLTNSSLEESVKITYIKVVDQIISGSSEFDFNIYNGSTFVGYHPITQNGINTSITVPANSSIVLIFYGDANRGRWSSATENATHLLSISASAIGVTSGKQALITTTNATSNPQTIVGAKLAIQLGQIGPSLGRNKSEADRLTYLNLGTNSSGAIAINSVKFTFNGSIASSSSFLDGVRLLDSSGNEISTNKTKSGSCDGVNFCSIILNFGAGGYGKQIAAGTTDQWTLVVDSYKTSVPPMSGVSQKLEVHIASLQDIVFTDMNTGVVHDLGATSDVVTLCSDASLSSFCDIPSPIKIQSVSYAGGT